MPHSSSHRFENCFMPPKKFAWRLNNITRPSISNLTSSQETDISSQVKQEVPEMGFLPEIERLSSPPAHRSPELRPVSPTGQSLAEDAPLDFSMKHDIPKASNGLNNGVSPQSQMSNGPVQQSINFSERLKMLYVNQSVVAFPGMPNGTASPPKNNDSHWNTDKSPRTNYHDSQPSYENKNCPITDCSVNNPEWCVKDSVKIGMNGGTMTYKKSPEHPSFSKENSPVNESPILQKMLVSHDNTPLKLTTSEMQDIHISAVESLQHGTMADLLNIRSPILPPVNQSITSPLLSPVNGWSLTPMSYYQAMGYPVPAIGTLPGSMLTPGSDASTLQVMMARRPKKKRIDDRPFKSYPMEVLREKMQYVKGNSFNGLDYTPKIVAPTHISRSPPSDSRISAVSDPNKKEETSEIVNSAINSNSSNTTNGTADPPNVNGFGDSNDSVSSISPDGVENSNNDENRKRKTTADTEKDDAYWDRRKKNNLAAKRSREARRLKEDAIANMAVHLETENNDLRSKLAAMNFNFSNYMGQFNTLRQDYEALKIQNNILQERLSQKRCGQCGAELPSVN